MYSSCLVCHRDLGGNSQLPSFPVGTKIGFAEETGRLWVICEDCGEWNLAPIAERWEAVEECAALYDTTIERASGRGMSLGRADGIELVRIGSEEELPTLRYGDRLRNRQRRRSLRGRLTSMAQRTTVFVLALLAAGLWGVSGFFLTLFFGSVALTIATELVNPVVAKVPAENEWHEVRRHEVRDARLVPDGEDAWALRIRKGLDVPGAHAMDAVRLLLPLFPSPDDPAVQLRKALAYIDRKGGTAGSVFAAAARRRGRRRTARLSKLEPHIRLALEMLASREVEARAVAGDLEHLQSAWRNAHELAGIQDELTYGPGLLGRLEDLKG